MTSIRSLFGTLEQLLQAAKQGDKKRVLELNRIYESRIPGIYHTLITLLESEYDDCRQSCFLAVTSDFLQKEALKDAEERYLRISKTFKRPSTQ